MLGGAWSKGDVLALVGVLVAVLGIWVAHRDTARPEDGEADEIHNPSVGSGESQTKGTGTGRLATKAVTRNADVSSGQVNFGCEESQQVKTPEVFFGANARDIQPRTEWVQTDNAKNQNQQVIYDRNGGTDVRGVLAQGSITGLDKQVFNCPGGGHGSLALHVTWTEDQTSVAGKP
jgi:hypothetical protein